MKGVKTKMKKYVDYILEQAEKLISIDSPTGFTEKVCDYLMEEYTRLGYTPVKTIKGGILADMGGLGNGLVLMAHTDTLGAMVAEVKGNGALRLSPAGGLNANNIEGENCRIYTYDDRIYTGTIQLINASVHVNGEYNDKKRSFDTIEAVIDENVKNAEDTEKLGIETGCFVCVEPRTRITETGYIKSRFLDDKLSAAILLGYAKYLKDNNITPSRKVYEHITVFEEVGHGASAPIADEVTELLSVDMGCVGEGLKCTERQVSICVKDSAGPYHYDVVKKLISTAKENKIDYAADIYPHYASDADAAISGGADAKHGLIGPGVYASHGYERSHRDGVENTLKLIAAYV